MKRTDMKMRVERTITFLNLMNETIRRGDRLHSSARAKQCGVSTVVFQKAKELGVFKRDNYGRLLPRPHAIYAPTATMVIRAVDAYLHEAINRLRDAGVKSAVMFVVEL